MAFTQYVLPTVLGLSATIFLILKIFPWIKYDIQEIRMLGSLLIGLKRYQKKEQLIYDIFEEHADSKPNKTFLIYQDNNYTYQFMEKQMNKVANVGREIGIKKGDVVAMLMGNEPAFIWTAYGLGKLGAEPAYLNFNLRSKSLLHCFTVSGAKILIVGQADGLLEAVEEIYPELEAEGVTVYVSGQTTTLPPSFKSLHDNMTKASDARPDKSLRRGLGFRSTMCYIYTSGTTGLPKAAVVTHDKALKGGMMMSSMGVSSEDVFYTPLPLYHSAAGLVALGTTVINGGTLVLRSKFSATHFFEDCKQHKVTVIQYIGELCRYLCARTKSPADNTHCVRVAFGNGMRQDIWREFRDRFNIPQIGEFYAATEGNAGFINHYNKFGAIGRSSPLLRLVMPAAFIKYDVAADEPVRDSKGFCIPVGANEPGLMVSQIRKDFHFDGYKGNKDLSTKKVIQNVFKKGDKYFNTGDLLEFDQDYFIYFKDRIGDTFRWKGENVSTIEVSNVVSDVNQIQDANIYGVEIQGQDGRCGMASLSMVEGHDLDPDTDLAALYNQLAGLLPQYAWPRFVRVQKQHHMTATFKLRKVELVKDGFDPDTMGDEPLFYLDIAAKCYKPLTKSVHRDILDGKVRL